MVIPFLVLVGEGEAAAQQYTANPAVLRHGANALWGHMYDLDSDAWVREERWATGNGWVVAGLSRALGLDAGALAPEVRTL